MLSLGSVKIGNAISNLTIIGQGSSKTTIDAGSASDPAYYGSAFLSKHATDQRGTGFARTVSAATDIGAYERQSGAVDA